MKPTRKAALSLSYNSADISADVSPFLLSFTYNDKANGEETDDLTVVFEDKDGLWKGSWFPSLGAELRAGITCRDWPGGPVLDCGAFEIDDFDAGGPPSTFTIKALAVGVTHSIRREQKSREWEKIPFSAIAAQVAAEHGFKLHYDAQVYPFIDRHDQREQSDIELLGGLCKDNGLGMKIKDGKLIIFEELLHESQAPALTLHKTPESRMERYRLSTSSADIYAACEVKYVDPRERILISYVHKAGASEWSQKRPPAGHVLRLNKRCSCEAEAERLAKAALREHNKREITGSISMLGNPELKSGIVVNISGFGRFDQGRYFIESVRHTYSKSGGYVTTAQIRGKVDY